MYIDGRPKAAGNIVGFINSSKRRYPIVRPICQFVEVINDKDGEMEIEVDRLIMVEAIFHTNKGTGP